MQKYIVIVLFSFTGHVRSYSSSPKIATIFESFMILNLIKKLRGVAERPKLCLESITEYKSTKLQNAVTIQLLCEY